MLSIQEKKEISNIFVAQIFLELLAIIFDTFLFEHPVELKENICQEGTFTYLLKSTKKKH